MNETYKIIQKIKQSIKDDIEDCGCLNLELTPISYGVVLGLKGALANINAIEKIFKIEPYNKEDNE